MNALGRHLLMELEDCNEETLNDLETLKAAMLTAADRNKLQFSPQGSLWLPVINIHHYILQLRR